MDEQSTDVCSIYTIIISIKNMSTAITTEEEVHEHHHKETFITKYIFSQDHKMIAKQYLITGLFMGIIGIAMSLLFRVQLAWPDQSFKIFEVFLGKWAP